VSEQGDINKAVVRRIYEQGYNAGEITVFEELYAPHFVHHSKVIFDVPAGGAGERESMRRFRAAMPDAHFEILDQMAERDLVATRLRITGHPVAGYGQELTPGLAFDVHALALFRVEDGRVTEEWLFVDGGRSPD
jgi:predicted SnoaL-like aldol condensation-catalyzing enzyme